MYIERDIYTYIYYILYIIYYILYIIYNNNNNFHVNDKLIEIFDGSREC